MSNLLLSLLLGATLPGIFGEGVIGSSANSVILINATGLKIVRVIIGDKIYEDIETKADKLLVSVTPKRHHLELIFRGGTRIDWVHFDFAHVHQVTFELVGNRVSAYPK